MVPKADELLEKYIHPSGKLSVAMSFTGSDGLILKTALMEAFTNFDSPTAVRTLVAVMADAPNTTRTADAVTSLVPTIVVAPLA